MSPSQRADLLLAPGLVVGEVIAGKYRIERLIGRGGMGVVVAASQLSLDRRVAIKLIRDEWAQEPMAVARLLREGKAAASIQSEHVARVLDVGTLEGGAPFIVMEYLEGNDLDTLIRRDGPLPVGDAVDYILQACEALAEAHKNGIVHRDLKPANVFVARQPGGVPCIKVVDFGISKLIGQAIESLTHPSRVVGSLYHMAPEQMRGKAVDARTDVWAIGVLLFEMLTGKKLFRDTSWPDVCAQVLNDSTPLGKADGAIPPELEQVIQRCLCRDPDARFANVAELAVALVPFGRQSSRLSLERIVRIATSTGSLSAETWTPPPPATAPERDSELPPSLPERETPMVAPSAELVLNTRSPMELPVADTGVQRQRVVRGALAVSALAMVAALLLGLRRTRDVPLAEPPATRPASEALSLPASPPVQPSQAQLALEPSHDAPTISVVREPQPAPVAPSVANPPSPPAPAAPSPAVPATPAAAAPPALAPAHAPSVSVVIAEPTPTAGPAPEGNAAPSTAPGAAPTAEVGTAAAPGAAGAAANAAPAADGAPAAEAPPEPEPPAPPAAGAASGRNAIDPWDLSSVTFKRKTKAPQ